MSERITRPRDAVVLIKRCMEKRRAVMIWGPPGIGKSELIEQIGAELDREVIDLRLLLMEPTDLKGIPYYDPESNTMRWAPPGELPAVTTQADVDLAEARLAACEQEGVFRDIDIAKRKLDMLKKALRFQNAILFLDEIASAPPSVQASAYQLVLNYRVGEYRLPLGISIVCAGNRDTDRGVTYRMPSPLANRLVHIEMAVNYDDWQAWAIKTMVNADVVGFLAAHKQHLFTFDPKSNDKAFATPRSWVALGDLITDDLPESLNTTLAAGTVGEGLAISFTQHRKISSKMPKSEDILTGGKPVLQVKEISALYSLTISLCYTLQEWTQRVNDTEDPLTNEQWHYAVDCFFRYMMDNFQTELIVLGAKTALRDYQLPINHRLLKEFTEFHKQYGKFILEDY